MCIYIYACIYLDYCQKYSVPQQQQLPIKGFGVVLRSGRCRLRETGALDPDSWDSQPESLNHSRSTLSLTCTAGFYDLLCLLAVETIEPAEPLNSSQEVLSSTNSENLSQQHHVVLGYPLEQDLPAKAGQVSARSAQAGTSWNFWHQLKTRPCSTPAQHPGFARGRSQEPGPPYPAALRDAWWYGSNLFGCSTTTLKEIWSPRLLGLERSSLALH